MARSVRVALLLIFHILNTPFLSFFPAPGILADSQHLLWLLKLPAYPCGLLVFTVKPFFLCQPASFFLGLHFGELRPVKNPPYIRLYSPVKFKFGFMLRLKLPSVLWSLVLLKGGRIFAYCTVAVFNSALAFCAVSITKLPEGKSVAFALT